MERFTPLPCTSMLNNLKGISHHRAIHTFTQLINPTLQLGPQLIIRLPHLSLIVPKFLLPLHILLFGYVDIRIYHIVRITHNRLPELRAQFVVVRAAVEDGGDIRGEVFEREEPGDEHFAAFVTDYPNKFGLVEPDAFVHGVGWELVADGRGCIGWVCGFIGRVCDSIGRVCDFRGRVRRNDGLLFGMGRRILADVGGFGRVHDF